MSWWLAFLLGMIVAAPWGPWVRRRLRRALHVLQLEEYENLRTLRWARRNWFAETYRGRVLGSGVVAVGWLLIAAVEISNDGSSRRLWIVLPSLFLFAGTRLFRIARREPGYKKPLVVTARVKRLIGALAVVMVTLAAAILLAGWALEAPGLWALLVVPLLAWLAVAAAPLLVVAANLLAAPVEWANRRRYRKEAEAHLRAVKPRIVAITGSYGKTTTKELIAAVLEARYRVLKTPASFNTVMGITRVVREQLRDDHEVFVVEMGAYEPGNIRELCRFVGAPEVSAIVGINEQHLERMGSLANTVRTKYEIVEETRPSGLAVFNVDNPACAGLADKTTRVRVARVGTGEQPNLDLRAANVTVTPKLMRFDVSDGAQSVTVRTRLIGRHLLPNILIALAIGRELGVELRTAAARVGAVQPVGHRLAVSEVDGMLLIDDAYSANVDGARAAIALLAELPAERRFLVTPGIVELGAVEAQRNRELGAQAAAVCDTLLVVGATPGRYVREGALAAGMPAERALAMASLAASQEYLRAHARPGDAVLFENDLPDNYA